ncbi:MAG TPA: hypothetical protein VK658_18580 [Chryseolinea sp.]|nr:hypothetical protein [Chryseolinea sp.]
MKLLTRYVLFYCDDCDLLKPAIAAFTSVHKYHTVLTSSDEEDLVKKMNEYKPELVWVYLNDVNKDYVTLVRKVRESTHLSNVPVFIYKSLPESDELASTFKNLKNFSQDSRE